MNNLRLPEFLDIIDTKTSEMSRDMLIRFIYEVARTVPEQKRCDWILLLNQMNHAVDVAAEPDAENLEQLANHVEAMIACLEEIAEDEDRYVDSEYNPEWDDWYNPDVDETLYYDSTDIASDIRRGMELIHRCVALGAYEKGIDLVDELLHLEIPVVGEDMEDTFSFLGFGEYFLKEKEIERFEKESLFVYYMGSPFEERMDNLYHCFEAFSDAELGLDDIWQMGGENLVDKDEFLSNWIEYLASHQDRTANRLLQEALVYTKSADKQRTYAKMFASIHPELYVQLLKKHYYVMDWQRVVEIGTEALDYIEKDKKEREEIALFVAAALQKLESYDKVEAYWFEAFRIHPTLENYMRLRFESKNWERYQQQVCSWAKDGVCNSKGVIEIQGFDTFNRMSGDLYKWIMLFEGEFEDVKNKWMNAAQGIGWSDTFMKEGLAFMLYLLYKKQEEQSGIAYVKELLFHRMHFSKESYERGMLQTSSMDSEGLLFKLIDSYKIKVDFTTVEEELWLKRIENWIQLRVDAIMKNTRRKYYDECAAWIAALGEVKESMGMYGEKAHIIGLYKKRYPRHSAFHFELSNFE